METRPGDPKHGDFARGWETLPRDERLGSFADGEETEQHDERPGSDGRMYQLIRQHDGLRQRTLEITFLESDAEAYSFTFG
jgi:Thioredoxin like C-terminal domain